MSDNLRRYRSIEIKFLLLEFKISSRESKHPI